MAIEIVDLPTNRTLLIFHSYGKEGMYRTREFMEQENINNIP